MLEIIIISFGYKEGSPPSADVIFDVRFLKNPYWVEELRSLAGTDEAIQKYVLEQPIAQLFLTSLVLMLKEILPTLNEEGVDHYTIALGCTGGQHRSVTLAEVLATKLKEFVPEFKTRVLHRELDNRVRSQP